jgi:hypothetical protein
VEEEGEEEPLRELVEMLAIVAFAVVSSSLSSAFSFESKSHFLTSLSSFVRSCCCCSRASVVLCCS